MSATPHTTETPIRLVDVTMVECCRALHTGFDEKLARAEQLAASGVDVLDVGSVLDVPGKLVLVWEIAQRVRQIAVAARTQGNLQDIQTAWYAIRGTAQPVLRVCVQISDWHREERLRVSENALQEHIRAVLTFARERCPCVEFVAEDSTRCDDVRLCGFLEAAISAGASAVTLSDMVGDDLPLHSAMRFRTVMERVAGMTAITLGVAAHNRYGYALDNTLAAITAGVRLVTVDESACGQLKRRDLEAALRREVASRKDEDEGKLLPPSSH